VPPFYFDPLSSLFGAVGESVFPLSCVVFGAVEVWSGTSGTWRDGSGDGRLKEIRVSSHSV
jgi:hypothetical protein